MLQALSTRKKIDKQNSTKIVANDSSTIFHLFGGYPKSNCMTSPGKTNLLAWLKAGHFGAACRVEGWSLPHLQHHGLSGTVGQDAWSERWLVQGDSIPICTVDCCNHWMKGTFEEPLKLLGANRCDLLRISFQPKAEV